MLSFSLVLSHIFVHFISRDCVVGLTVTAAEMLHRRRIYTEETEFIQILAVLTILHRDDLKNSLNRINSSISSYHPSAIYPFPNILLVQNSDSGERNLINYVPQTAATTFAFSS